MGAGGAEVSQDEFNPLLLYAFALAVIVGLVFTIWGMLHGLMPF